MIHFVNGLVDDMPLQVFERLKLVIRNFGDSIIFCLVDAVDYRQLNYFLLLNFLRLLYCRRLWNWLCYYYYRWWSIGNELKNCLTIMLVLEHCCIRFEQVHGLVNCKLDDSLGLHSLYWLFLQLVSQIADFVLQHFVGELQTLNTLDLSVTNF